MGAVSFSLDRRLIDALQSALPLDVLVETGTFEGDTLACLGDCFTALHSIELSPEYFAAAQARFAGNAKISLHQGNSAEKLKQVRAGLPADGVLYFLDAHWCVATSTAGETSQCPLLDEIAAIGSLGTGSVIVIDDARLFLAPPPAPHEVSQWPSFEQVSRALRAIGPDHQMMVANDLILFYPPAAAVAVSRFAAEHGVDWLEVMSKIRDYDNLREEFNGLQKQLEAADQERARLQELINSMQACKQQVSALQQLVERQAQAAANQEQARQQGLLDATPTCRQQTLALQQLLEQQAQIGIATQSSADQGRDNEQRDALLSALIEKEKVIKQLAAAVAAYRVALKGLYPAIMLINGMRKAWCAIKNRVPDFFRPKIGCLNQYPPRNMTLPASYWESVSLTSTPKVSIVTPSYNQAEYIERTMDSVLSQDYPCLEYYIQDGGSKDGTVELLKKYEKRIDGWVSAPDGGQSQAINLGFSKASGEIMAWLNSDDILLPGAIHHVVDYFNRNPDVDVVYGNRILIDEKDREIGRWVLPPNDDEVLSWADFVPQETLFWRRSIWDKAGGKIDESFRFAMDWDLLLRFRKAGAKMVRLHRYLGAFRIHTAQKTSAEIGVVGMQEMSRLREREIGHPVDHHQIKKALLGYVVKHLWVDCVRRILERFSKCRVFPSAK